MILVHKTDERGSPCSTTFGVADNRRRVFPSQKKAKNRLYRLRCAEGPTTGSVLSFLVAREP